MTEPVGHPWWDNPDIDALLDQVLVESLAVWDECKFDFWRTIQGRDMTVQIQPTRPREVVISRSTGELVQCEVAYKGQDDLLIGQWEVSTRLRVGDVLWVRGLGRNHVIAYMEESDACVH